jgi:hypothetical protein
MYAAVDVALLNSEWAGGQCPTCGAAKPADTDTQAHNPACEHDLALSERQFPTQSERNAARKRLVTANALGPTVPPPPSTT